MSPKTKKQLWYIFIGSAIIALIADLTGMSRYSPDRDVFKLDSRTSSYDSRFDKCIYKKQNGESYSSFVRKGKSC